MMGLDRGHASGGSKCFRSPDYRRECVCVCTRYRGLPSPVTLRTSSWGALRVLWDGERCRGPLRGPAEQGAQAPAPLLSRGRTQFQHLRVFFGRDSGNVTGTESVFSRSHTRGHLNLCHGLPREASGSAVEAGAGSLSIITSLQGSLTQACSFLDSQRPCEVPLSWG